jgi:Fic family protein
MPWNWELSNWPHFHWDSEKLKQSEKLFIENAGIVIGASAHLSNVDHENVVVSLLSRDALDTSEIEGEHLNRDSIQSSIRKALGLQADRVHSKPAEAGVSEMIVDLYRHANKPITQDTLFQWHQMIMNGRRDVECIGSYRAHLEPMQIVSGPDYARKVYFEAPPSSCVSLEMDVFLKWLSDHQSLDAVTRAGVAHIWFECIHPFEDGNGRIGRAIAEKILSEGFSAPVFIVLSKSLLKHRKAYYDALAKASKRLDITEWLMWFAHMVLEAQRNTLHEIEFIIQKGKLLDRVRGQLNPRQEKAVLRMFREGPEGFAGGLSASNYMQITGAISPTTTRDLQDLVMKGVLYREGERKAARYFLNVSGKEK